MSVPVEQLRAPILNERVLVEWIDVDTNQPCALGSCSLANRQAPKLTIRAHVEPTTGRIRVLFSLLASVRAGGRNLRREFLLVFPSRALVGGGGVQPAFTLDVLPASDLARCSRLDGSTFDQAGIASSGRVVRAQFSIAATGHVLMPVSTSRSIRPSTSTSRDLLLGLQSLSKTLQFTTYVKPSDYALQGWESLRNGLRDLGGQDGCGDTRLSDTYGPGRDAMLVDWDKLSGNDGRGFAGSLAPPPPYQSPHAQKSSPSRVLKSPSPPVAAGVSSQKSTAPSDDLRIPETPIRAMPSPSPPAEVLHGVFSDVESDHAWHTLSRPSEAGSPATGAAAVDSDEESLALVRAREISLEQRRVGSGGKNDDDDDDDDDYNSPLFSELVIWLQGAKTIRHDVHQWTVVLAKLSALGQHVRTRNVAAFDGTRAWCSALVFFYGRGGKDLSAEEAALSESLAARQLISDMADLTHWAGLRWRGCDMSVPLIRREFARLGDAARTVAVKGAGSLAEYEHQKDLCIARTLVICGDASTRKR